MAAVLLREEAVRRNHFFHIELISTGLIADAQKLFKANIDWSQSTR